MIEQTPTDTSVTEVPDTVHTAALLLAKLTANPDEADAVKLTGPAASAVSAGCVKVIVCAPLSTLNVLVTGVAAKKLALPACDAVIEQMPAVTSVTLEAATVQTAAELLA